MCVMSMVMDHQLQQPPEYWLPYPHRVHDFEELLRKAKLYDEEHNQPNCELGDKKAALKKIAETLGVEIRFP